MYLIFPLLLASCSCFHVSNGLLAPSPARISALGSGSGGGSGSGSSGNTHISKIKTNRLFLPSPLSLVQSSNSHQTDPTSSFNNDIHRIASRTNSRNSNFNPIHAAERAEAMLLQMISMYKSSNRKTARPNIETFRIVINGYANLKGYRWEKSSDGGDNNGSFGYSSSAFTNTWGDEFIDHMQKENDANANEEQRETQVEGDGGHDANVNVNANLHAENDNDNEMEYDNQYNPKVPVSKNQREAAICAADRVDFVMEQLYKLQLSEKEAGNDITNLQLNTEVCNLCLLAYARCSHPQKDSHSNKNSIVGQQEQGHGDNKVSHQLDNPFLMPLSKKGSYAQRAERLVKYMLHLSKEQDGPQEEVEPNGKTYSYLIWALSRQQPDARKSKRQYNSYNNESNDMKINHYAIRASEWIPHIEALYENFIIKNGVYDHKKRILRKHLLWAYSDVLTAWSKCSAMKSPKKVYKYMTLIESLCEEDKVELENVQYQGEVKEDELINDNDADTNAFTDNWSSATEPLSNEEYEPYLDQQIPLYPSEQCYTRAILSLSKSKELGSAQRANQLLYKTLDIYESGQWGRNKPSIYAFNGAISAWANCASSSVGNADKAELILDLMEELYFDQDKPEYDHLKPDRISFNTAIKAWTNSREDASVLKAQRLFERMEKRFDALSDEFLDVKPDSYTYNTMITGWLRSDLGVTSAENAELLLRKMVDKYLNGEKDLEPNQKIFSSIIDKWAKTDPSRNIAVKHAVDLLQLMETSYEAGCKSLRPDKITYTNIIDAIARSRSPTGAPMALSLLKSMEEKFRDGDYNIKPSLQTYSCTLLSLLNSDIEDKHEIAQGIPKRMEAIGLTPNAFTWNYIIHVAASVSSKSNEETKMQAFKVALNAFQTLRKSKDFNTDSFTYTFFLKAINHLMSSSVMRSSIIKETFRDCVAEGKVNDQVLSRLVWAIPQEEIRDIVGPVRISDIRNIKAHDVPPEWGRNVQKRKHYRK